MTKAIMEEIPKFAGVIPDVKTYMAGTSPWRNTGMYDETIVKWKPYILESFFYADADTERLIPYYGDFLLDSGAFTFMQNQKTHTDWDEYIRRYAEFIVRNDVKKYFELDIDSVVGYKQVLKYRDKLESLTNKPCIPVWHKSRGIKEYIRTCKEYDYVAIGGIVAREIKPKQYGAFPSMIKIAHENGAKVHGLGFTNLALLSKIHFDSVDSTSWTTGNRFGYLYKFNGKTVEQVHAPKGMRIKESRKAAFINYCEWIKFQKYADRNL